MSPKFHAKNGVKNGNHTNFTLMGRGTDIWVRQRQSGHILLEGQTTILARVVANQELSPDSEETMFATRHLGMRAQIQPNQTFLKDPAILKTLPIVNHLRDNKSHSGQ